MEKESLGVVEFENLLERDCVFETDKGRMEQQEKTFFAGKK